MSDPDSNINTGSSLSRFALLHSMTQDWVPPLAVREVLSEYFLIRLSGSDLQSRVSNGRVWKNSQWYSIVWRSTPESCYQCRECWLSFRSTSANPQAAYVLIRQGKRY